MTINSGTTKSGPYNANGSQTVFDYTFKIYASTDLEVIETSSSGVESIVSTSNYTVQGVGLESGTRMVTITSAPASGKKITIRLKPPVEQQTNLRNQGSYLPEVVERAFDRLVMITQYLAEELSRSIKVDISSGASITNYLQQCQTAATNAAASESTASAAATTASAAASSAAKRTTTAVSGNKTFALADADTYQRYTGSGSHIWTVPTNAAVAFPNDSEIDGFNASAFNLTITASTGVTVNGVTSPTVGAIVPPYSGFNLKKNATNTWDYSGFAADSWV